jgi:hypothetical protein
MKEYCEESHNLEGVKIDIVTLVTFMLPVDDVFMWVCKRKTVIICG